MSDHRSWMTSVAVPGGTAIYCDLCGRDLTKQTFMAARTSETEAAQASESYRLGHQRSGMHRAALDAYHAPADPEPSPDDHVLAGAFGKPLPTGREIRLRAARKAAHSYRSHG